MIQKAQIYTSRDNQIVQLPAGVQFKGTEVLVTQDPDTGDVLLREKPQTWDDFFAIRDEAIAAGEACDDLIDFDERKRTLPPPDPFADLTE
ncbi:MAG: AbrB/MazE/SpoVT family DNA-binding domain-containing protein [Chloroflexota bacterium]|nr:AbrB/MazE/SpoVT family DNA-binding domain-containing protein [Chloroflexota bacterium]